MRALGKQLDVSVATVMQAYESLEKTGLLKVRPQSGFYVQATPASQADAPRWPSTPASARKVQIGAHMNEVLASSRASGVLNLPGAMYYEFNCRVVWMQTGSTVTPSQSTSV